MNWECQTLLTNFWSFPVDLSANQKVDELIERIRDAGIPDLRLIFIDTWIKSIGAIQTNSDIETIACIKNMERIAAAFNCFVFAIDYAGKDADRGLRGSSVKNQGVDVVIKVKAEDRDVSLFTEKLKEEDTSVLNHTFKVRQVEVKPPVGQEANEQWRITDGNSRQTLVVDFGEIKRKSCETKARELFDDGLDEDMVGRQLQQEYSKAQASKALKKNPYFCWKLPGNQLKPPCSFPFLHPLGGKKTVASYLIHDPVVHSLKTLLNVISTHSLMPHSK